MKERLENNFRYLGLVTQNTHRKPKNEVVFVRH